jgi:N-acetylmuramoyl-L-alanine amidase
MGSYLVPFRFSRLLSFLFLLLLVHSARAADWELLRLDGRDYVTVRSLAAFYGFPTLVPPVSQIPSATPEAPLVKHLLLDNGKHQIQFTLNDRLCVIDGVNQWLGFPVTEQGDQLIVSRIDLSKVIEPSLRPEFITGLSPVDTVVLDPGHGGHDKGATCIFGNEKDFALDVCMRARALLEAAGLKVLMTRTDDTFIPLEERPTLANATPNSIFVAMHFNDATTDATGFEIYSITPRGEPSTSDDTLSLRDFAQEPGNATDVQSQALSESIYNSLLGNVPQVDRGVKHARFAVIRLAQVPAVLIEGGFLSSDTEARLIATPSYRQALAEAIVAGIEGFKTLAEHHIPPKLVADYRNQPALQAAPTVVTNGSSLLAPTLPDPSPSLPDPSVTIKATQ